MKYILGKNTTRNLESILIFEKKASKILVNAVKGFIKVTPMDFCIIENGGYRHAEMQNSLFKNGVSKCDGYDKISEHQLCLAIDLVPYINGKASWTRENCLFLAGAFLSYCKVLDIPITSGADWDGDGNLKDDSWDPCHMQIEEIQ